MTDGIHYCDDWWNLLLWSLMECTTVMTDGMHYCDDWWNARWFESDSSMQMDEIHLVWLQLIFGLNKIYSIYFHNNSWITEQLGSWDFSSLLCFILFIGYLLSRGSNTNGLCFALISFLIRLPSTFQNFFTFTLPPGSSALLQTPECSQYHPSELSPVVSALSLTRLQLFGINSLFLSAILPLSALLNLPWKLFSF